MLTNRRIKKKGGGGGIFFVKKMKRTQRVSLHGFRVSVGQFELKIKVELRRKIF